MAMQQSKASGFAARLGDKAKQTYEANKAKAAVANDYSELPGGVSGVARLAQCEFRRIDEVKPNDKSGAKVGDYRFLAMGVVVEPEWFTDAQGNKIRTKGKQTRIFEALHDTPMKSEKGRHTQAEHLDWVINQIKSLMGGTLEGIDISDLETVMASLVKQGVHFAFTVTEGTPSPQYPKPMKFHNWLGRVDDYTPEPSSTPMTRDTTATTSSTPSTNGTHAAAVNPPTAPATTIGRPAAVTQRSSAPVPPTQSFDEFGDIDSVVARAMAGETGADAELKTLAMQAGVPEEDVENANDWEEVGALIKGVKDQGSPSGDDGDDDDTKPKVGVVYKYLPLGKKKMVDVECVSIKGEKCNLKNLATEEIYKGIPFADVKPAG